MNKLGYDYGYCILIYNQDANYFSEFNKLKPNNIGGYWWPLYDTEIRIKNFDILIKKMNRKIPLYKRIINFFTNNKNK